MQGIEGTLLKFPLKTDFLAVIEKNKTESARQNVFRQMQPFLNKFQSQRPGSLDYLCNGVHKHPGNYSYKEYVKFFLHVQTNHLQESPEYCLVCGDNTLSSHFRTATKDKTGGKGYIGNCKKIIDATNPRLSKL